MSTTLNSILVDVELGECRVVKDYNNNNNTFTLYTLKFIFDNEIHIFTSRYSKLYEIDKLLSNNLKFKESFKNNKLPKFPSKNYLTNYRKPENYKKRANELLNYFKILISSQLILKNELFQNCIKLPNNIKIKLNKVKSIHNYKSLKFTNG